MKIRTKLALNFFVLVILVVSVVSFFIYFFSANYRQVDFYRRLKNRAINTALVLIEIKQIDAVLLKKMEQENPANLPNQFVEIYDVNKNELYSSDVDDVIPFDNSFLDQVREEGEINLTKNGYEVLGFYFVGRNENLLIVAGARDVYGLDALRNLRRIILITFSTSLILVSVFGWFFSGRALRPISKIIKEVDSITAASLDQRLNEGNGKDELGKLAQTFNRMLSRIEAAFLAQKNFIANASHELKTPFTVMAGQIEVTLLHNRDNEYYVKILRSVLDGIRGFNKLSTQLLLLAQTSAELPQKRFSGLRVDDFLWEAKQELEALHKDYIIEILFDLNLTEDLLTIKGDELLLKVLIMNLMDNGCKYSDNNRVQVTLTTSPGHVISIEFLNNGDGIQESELEKIFEPFYRGSATKKISGFGVGLSLAARIAKLHDGTIVVESIPQQETRFILKLPVHS
jgi:signal transduction histidine kinase